MDTKMIQNKTDLNNFYKKEDPWGYENNAEDIKRKSILLNELVKLPLPKRILDIGCGSGFVTRELRAEESIIGVDISKQAILQAKKLDLDKSHRYIAKNMFDLTRGGVNEKRNFDMILITGVMYPQYIGKSKTVMYQIIDELLSRNGILVTVHIDEWYTSRFPYILVKNLVYKYREYQHILEVYIKP
jgi:predicted TPR repeat methyltransferase